MGLLESVLQAALAHIPAIISVAIVAYLLSNYFNHGLNKYPGPAAAKFTNWWRFVDVYRRRPEVTHINLHKQHGDIVRLGPNYLSFADPRAIKQIYGLNKGYVKSGFYPVQQAVAKGERMPSLFSTLDESYHAQLRRSVNSAFSMSALVQYEPGVNVVTEQFLKRTEELFVNGNRRCDFTEWLQYFAFDGIGQITYSQPHGFLERDEDVDGIVAFLRKLFDYVAPIGQIPLLDVVFMKNPILRFMDKHGYAPSAFPVVKFAQARMAERMGKSKSTDIEKQPVSDTDLLSKFLKAKEDRPEFFNDSRVLVMALSMALAGSETTAISLAAVFYYLLKNPTCLEKLVKEIDDAFQAGQIMTRTSGVVTFAEAQTLPYLNACVQEAFRMHPAAGLPLERVTPPEGVEICGERIPGGTIVGCSAWLIHRRPEIFGKDVDAYKPERWIECPAEKRKEMDGTMFQFGAGSRTCIGKNISLLEIYKLVPSFLRRFKICLDDPEKEWTPHNAWFVRQKDFYTRFEVRNRS